MCALLNGGFSMPSPAYARAFYFQTNLQFNNNKYYLLQLLEDDTSKSYSVWLRWGRGKLPGLQQLSFSHQQAASCMSQDSFRHQQAASCIIQDSCRRQDIALCMIQHSFRQPNVMSCIRGFRR